jgi:hypothetical protein
VEEAEEEEERQGRAEGGATYRFLECGGRVWGLRLMSRSRGGAR